jgi:hypothetical protein
MGFYISRRQKSLRRLPRRMLPFLPVRAQASFVSVKAQEIQS